ncbi:MAG TPA: glycogen/starch synthase, partial [Alphaproteobacteria bacterium]
MQRVRVQFVAAEIFPLAKTGGLADVCAALPRALAERGVDVRLTMPAYESALDQALAPVVAADLGEVLGVERVRLLRARAPDSGLPLWLVDAPALFRRSGGPYQDAEGRDWPDNARRFAVFAHAAARIALGRAGLDWVPDVVHCHDWHAGLVPLLLRAAAERPPSLFTVHNMSFQGTFPESTLGGLGLPVAGLTDGVEFYGQLSFLKAGLSFADGLTTVSETYAREIQTPEFGHGLDG